MCKITACFKSQNSGCYGYHFFMYKILIHLPYYESENKLFYLYTSFRVI